MPPTNLPRPVGVALAAAVAFGAWIAAAVGEECAQREARVPAGIAGWSVFFTSDTRATDLLVEALAPEGPEHFAPRPPQRDADTLGSLSGAGRAGSDLSRFPTMRGPGRSWLGRATQNGRGFHS